MRQCKYCGHTNRHDLLEVVDNEWRHSHWTCADRLLCDLRARDRVPSSVVESAKDLFFWWHR
jgi:hypothetical protein